jgi:hypothetical protein
MGDEIGNSVVRWRPASDRRWWFFWCGDTCAGAERA